MRENTSEKTPLKSSQTMLSLAFTLLSIFVFTVVIMTQVSVAYAQLSDTASASALTVSDLEKEQSQRPLPSLQQLAIAAQSLNFEMSLIVYRPGNEPVPYVWRRGNLAGERVEYLNELNGPGAQIIRFGEMVSYFQADTPAYTLAQDYLKGVLPHNLLHNPQAFAAAYDTIYVGRARVAGLAAHQFRIVSKDKSRYNYTLWLDEATSLPIKFTTFTLSGELLESVQVTHLEVTQQAHSSFASIDRETLPAAQHLNPNKDFTLNWTISKLPVGMSEVQRRVTRLAITGELAEHILLSDGLVDVSVYLQPAGDVAQEDVLLRNQSDTFLARVKDDVQVSVVGKIPAQTANTLLQYIRILPGEK
jgi:sigma-E factor negative regulatory protein RseB